MPNGKLQSDVILKADYDQNVKDARELTALAKSIELELEIRTIKNVLSLGLLKKLDDVEKITLADARTRAPLTKRDVGRCRYIPY